MITYFLFFVVVSLAAGLVIQGYDEGLMLKMEIAGYSVEMSAIFLVFALSALALVVALISRLFLAYALCIYKMKCRAVTKRYSALGQGYALLSFGGTEDIKKVVGAAKKAGALDNRSLILLEGCAYFRLGQYEMADRCFLSISEDTALSSGLGLWLVRALSNEKSRDCKLRVLSRLQDIFCKRPWSVVFRVEALRMKEQWSELLQELKVADKLNVELPYNRKRIAEIARCMSANLYLLKGEYKQGLRELDHIDGLRAAVMRAQICLKLKKPGKAMYVLESYYRIMPHPELAQMYIEAADDKLMAMERLSGLRPEHYVSVSLAAKRYMETKQYGAAEQCLGRAIAKYRYVSLYCMMLDVMVCLGNTAGVSQWLDRMKRDSIPDARWECNECCTILPEWKHECSSCNAFDSIQWME